MFGFGGIYVNREENEADEGYYRAPVAAPRLIIIDRDQVATVMVGKYPLLPNQLPSIDGAWTWIRKENQEIHRNTRLHAGQLLRTAFEKGGYAMRDGRNTKTVKFKNLSKMVKGTRVLSVQAGLPELKAKPEITFEFDFASNPIDKAVELTLAGYNVATTNAASAYHAGGGFTSGGRHALEEAFCSQSTLYQSLEKIADGEPAYYFQGFHSHIPEDGCILSPHVEVFRRGTDQGYPLVASPVVLTAVVSVAMYNKNPKMRDAPVDAPADEEQYAQGVQNKMRALVHAAIFSGADALVVPDIGCGVFENDPVRVGNILGEVISEYHGYFRLVTMTGSKRFYSSVAQTIQGQPNAGPRLRRSMDFQRTTDLMHICCVCQQRMGGDGAGLATIVGLHGERTEPPFFIHACCSDQLNRPDHSARALPDPAMDPEGFFWAIDADGNGVLEREEVRWLVGALWRGPMEEFDAEFDALWGKWDADQSGELSWYEVQRDSTLRRGGDVQNMNLNAIDLQVLPEYLLDWIKAQAGGKVGPDEYPDPAL